MRRSTPVRSAASAMFNAPPTLTDITWCGSPAATIGPEIAPACTTAPTLRLAHQRTERRTVQKVDRDPACAWRRLCSSLVRRDDGGAFRHKPAYEPAADQASRSRDEDRAARHAATGAG